MKHDGYCWPSGRRWSVLLLAAAVGASWLAGAAGFWTLVFLSSVPVRSGGIPGGQSQVLCDTDRII